MAKEPSPRGINYRLDPRSHHYLDVFREGAFHGWHYFTTETRKLFLLVCFPKILEIKLPLVVLQLEDGQTNSMEQLNLLTQYHIKITTFIRKSLIK